MKYLFHDKANLGGVYKITNLSNGRIYIGSTVRFKQRAMSHRNDLLMNRHLNRFLQNDFNKCGSDNFLFEVVEVVPGDKKDRSSREQHFLDQFYDKQKNCYNLVPRAIDSRGGSRNKKEINRLTDGRCKSPTPEVKEKRVKGVVEAYASNPALAEVGRVNAKKRWDKLDTTVAVVHQTTGEVAVIAGSIRAWCTERGLNYKAFHLLVSGKTKKSAGWTLYQPI